MVFPLKSSSLRSFAALREPGFVRLFLDQYNSADIRIIFENL
jgi:hypothetical protein